MNRRSFLKIMLGTAPGVAIIGMQSSLWPTDQKERPENDPVTIYIDKGGYLYDPDYGEDPVTRRVFYGIDGMNRCERYDFYRDHLGEQTLQNFLWGDVEDADDVRVSFSKLNEIDNSVASYFDDELDPEEGSFRDILEKSRYWNGAWLYDNLPADALQRLDLDYVEGDQSGSSFCAVRYTGSPEKINTVLFTCGLNAVCFKES